jgi:hypothetical protein
VRPFNAKSFDFSPLVLGGQKPWETYLGGIMSAFTVMLLWCSSGVLKAPKIIQIFKRRTGDKAGK